jgi:hypothetical protein
MMVGIDRQSIAIISTNNKSFIAWPMFVVLPFLSVPLVIAARAEGTQVTQVQLQVWVGGAWVDVIHPGCTLASDAGAADRAAPAVPIQGHEAQGAPSRGGVEAGLHRLGLVGGWVRSDNSHT